MFWFFSVAEPQMVTWPMVSMRLQLRDATQGIRSACSGWKLGSKANLGKSRQVGGNQQSWVPGLSTFYVTMLGKHRFFHTVCAEMLEKQSFFFILFGQKC